MIQSGGIEMELSGHELIYFSRKKLLLKLNEHYIISPRSMKIYPNETFVEKIRSVIFP